MENENINPDASEQDINRQFAQQFGQQPFGNSPNLPNAVASLVLGIVATFFGLIWCYWVGSLIGIVCGIIAISLANSGRRLIANGGVYSLSSINNNNAGRILGIIGLILGGLGMLGLIIFAVIWGAAIGSYGAWH